MLNALFGIIILSSLNLTQGNMDGPKEIPESINIQENISKLQEYGYFAESDPVGGVFFLVESDDGGRSTLKIEEKINSYPFADETNKSSIHLTLVSNSNKGESNRGLYLINTAIKWMSLKNIQLPLTIDIEDYGDTKFVKSILDIGFKKGHFHMEKRLSNIDKIYTENIRKANLFDLFEIVNLFIETSKWHQKIHSDVYWGSRIPVYKRYLQILRAMILQDIILVSERDKNINGFCWGKKLREDAEIEEIFVSEDSRGYGFGKGLILNFEESVKRSGIDKVFFSVSGNNHNAVSFYKTQGYSVGSVSLYKPLYISKQ